MTAAVNAAGRTTAASLPCCLTNRRIECVKEAVVYVGFAARISVSRVAATGRVPVLAVHRWPAAMRFTPDFETSMTAM
jgi:hypothetical protein